MTKHRNRLPTAVLIVGVVVALASMGLVWAHWTDTLVVEGEVPETRTGEGPWIFPPQGGREGALKSPTYS